MEIIDYLDTSIEQQTLDEYFKYVDMYWENFQQSDTQLLPFQEFINCTSYNNICDT
jgi:hypothetical protein